MDAHELQHKYDNEKDPDVRERLLMIIWLKKGKSTYDVAALLDCPQSKVAYWKKRFETEGVDGLKTRPRSGKPPRLSDDEVKRIIQKLESVNYWQTKWVMDLIYQDAGVTSVAPKVPSNFVKLERNYFIYGFLSDKFTPEIEKYGVKRHLKLKII